MQKPARSKGEEAHLLRACFRIAFLVETIFHEYENDHA